MHSALRVARVTDEKKKLRWELICSGAPDVPMSVAEAALFLGWSESKLEESNIPRGKVDGRVVFLRSQLIKYIEGNTPHLIKSA